MGIAFFIKPPPLKHLRLKLVLAWLAFIFMLTFFLLSASIRYIIDYQFVTEYYVIPFYYPVF